MSLKFEIRYTISTILICLGIISSNFTLNKKSIPSPSFIQYHLAFSVNPSQGAGTVNYALVAVKDGKIMSRKFIDVNTFLLYGTGKVQSAANPEMKNLFDEFKLSDCFYKYDSIQDDYNECFTLKDLWALRYSKNPICPEGCTPAPGMRVEGWSQGKFHPSWPQIQILQNYGVIQDSDFFYGENMFRLFQDMEDPQWIEKYKAAV